MSQTDREQEENSIPRKIFLFIHTFLLWPIEHCVLALLLTLPGSAKPNMPLVLLWRVFLFLVSFAVLRVCLWPLEAYLTGTGHVYLVWLLCLVEYLLSSIVIIRRMRLVDGWLEKIRRGVH